MWSIKSIEIDMSFERTVKIIHQTLLAFANFLNLSVSFKKTSVHELAPPFWYRYFILRSEASMTQQNQDKPYKVTLIVSDQITVTNCFRWLQIPCYSSHSYRSIFVATMLNYCQDKPIRDPLLLRVTCVIKQSEWRPAPNFGQDISKTVQNIRKK